MDHNYVMKCNGNVSKIDAFWRDVLFEKDGCSYIRLGDGDEVAEFGTEGLLDANAIFFGSEIGRVPEKYFKNISARYPEVLITIICDGWDAGVREYQVYLGGKLYEWVADFYWHWNVNGEAETFNRQLADTVSRQWQCLLLNAS